MISPIEFRAWPKIARLKDSNVVITEKIDGTNAAVVIVPSGQDVDAFTINDANLSGARFVIDPATGTGYYVGAQSRTRVITPESDNFGFAKWVWDNAVYLAMKLGPGYHFGEWWGSGIQRGYGLTKGEKRFSLFNTGRWNVDDLNPADEFHIPALGVVPLLATTTGSQLINAVEATTEDLLRNGSLAAPGFMKPEGLVVYHVAAKANFKVLFEGNGLPKGLLA